VEVNIIQNKYLSGNPEKWSALYISGKMIKRYNNMSEDGTWKQELGEKGQIIALSTKVAELQLKLDKQVIALATQEKKKLLLMLVLAEVALAMAKGPVLTPFQHSF
jgi:hypothetical protein